MKHILSLRSFFFSIFCLFSILMMLCFSSVTADAAKQAVDTWLNVILPTLLPFSILTDLLLQSGNRIFSSRPAKAISGFFGFSENFLCVFCMSLLGGYPIGAKLTTSLYEQKQISSDEAALMLNAASTSGPSFLFSGVAGGMFQKPSLGIYFLIPHILAACIVALLNGHIPHSRPRVSKLPAPQKSLGRMFLSSVTRSTSNMLIVLGSMVLFSGFAAIARQILTCIFRRDLPLLSAMFSGIFEFSIGCKDASALSFPDSLILIGFFSGFGSLSVYLQTSALAADSGIRLKSFFTSKLLQGSLNALLIGVPFLRSAPQILLPVLALALMSCFFAIPFTHKKAVHHN